jgi:hypothetical protein
MAASLADEYLQKKFSKLQLEEKYNRAWKRHFAARLQAGRVLQGFFGSSRLSNLFVGTFRKAPILAKPVIRLTHGEPF